LLSFILRTGTNGKTDTEKKERRNSMEKNKDWQFANMTPQDIQKIQQLEPQLKASTGQNIVLIAYQQK
jgi:hypothetical protein